MMDVWHRCFEDIMNLMCEAHFSGWDTCDRSVRDEFVMMAKEDGMEDAFCHFIQTMAQVHQVDPQIMFDSVMDYLLNLDEESMQYLLERDIADRQKIRYLRSALDYLLECGVQTGDRWSRALSAIAYEDVNLYASYFELYTVKLELKGWLIDRMWGLLDQTIFREECTLEPCNDPADFCHQSWLYLTQTSKVLSSLCEEN